jgi:hypothetical protein
MSKQGTVGDMLRTRRTGNGVWIKTDINMVKEKVIFWKRVTILISIVNIILLGVILL